MKCSARVVGHIFVAIVGGFMPMLASANCDTLTTDGVFEYRSLDSEEARRASFLNYARDRRQSSSDQSRGANAGYLAFSAGYSDAQKAQLAQDIENFNKSDTAMQSRVSAYAKSASETLVNAVVECQKIRGLKVWLSTTADPQVFWLVTNYLSDRKNDSYPLLESIAITPPAVATVEGGPKLPAKIEGHDPRWVISRKDGRCDAFAVTLDVSVAPQGGNSLTVPASKNGPCGVVVDVAKSRCNLHNTVVLVHWSQDHPEFLTRATKILEAAGAKHENYMKPRGEKGMPNFFRAFAWQGSSKHLAEEVQKCLKPEAPFASMTVSDQTQFIEASQPSWKAKYSAVVYLVDQ